MTDTRSQLDGGYADNKAAGCSRIESDILHLASTTAPNSIGERERGGLHGCIILKPLKQSAGNVLVAGKDGMLDM